MTATNHVTSLAIPVNTGQLREVPGEDWKDVFLCCDVATRCKLRRTSKYWKHLTCQPDISEIVLVNPICWRIPNKDLSDVAKNNPARLHAASSGDHDYHYFDHHFHDLRFASPEYHKRHGILGPHVRIMIYDAALVPHLRRKYHEDSCSGENRVHPIISDPYQAVRAIGLHCSNLQHLVLWNASLYNFRNFSRSSLQFLTVIESTIYQGVVRLPAPDLPEQDRLRKAYPMKIVFHYASLPVDLRLPPLHCLKEEYAWVAKHAPRLPEHYHQWAQSGIDLYRIEARRTGSHQKFFPAVNLHEINSDTVTDHDLLQILTFCIRFENLPDTEAPPSSLDVWDACAIDHGCRNGS